MGKGSIDDYGMMLDTWGGGADGKSSSGIKTNVLLLIQSKSVTRYVNAWRVSIFHKSKLFQSNQFSTVNGDEIYLGWPQDN